MTIIEFCVALAMLQHSKSRHGFEEATPADTVHNDKYLTCNRYKYTIIIFSYN